LRGKTIRLRDKEHCRALVRRGDGNGMAHSQQRARDVAVFVAGRDRQQSKTKSSESKWVRIKSEMYGVDIWAREIGQRSFDSVNPLRLRGGRIPDALGNLD
jgi:hypothetical protein